ncbi:nitrate reductase subunit alpha [Candidatus Parabeggiatoa sp. HSG14]|uniref:nitrate reductase subunit alpha n=1 Tax=Candidatus Parabeggiatoa sp. HSG14 TaxID=3055593 RepID=UPI0025A8377E|nr:nitrate reductase subunit alpha [Thiotrichales bacterium HSG14]
MSWIQDIIDPKTRQWEQFYRSRWQYDNIVRSTHGVNCTGGCSWRIYVKCGVITWEMQQVDYPKLEKTLPPYEPRGCQRGISASWYVYSPIRVRYPYVRGVLIDLWRQARQKHDDPVDAWQSLVNDPESRKKYQQARGKGGFRRSDWHEVLEIISAANVHTIKEYGPDRIVGFSPIPAMSQLSFASGSRFLSLMGGQLLSFYDWYSDLPPAEPEVWGEQTDAHESADWYNSKFIVSMGSNLNMTRTPDVHFISEARHNGSKFVVFAPDFSQVAKFSDWWVPVNAGQDGAFWMSVNHVILTEYYVKKKTPSFEDYMKQFTDSPFLVVINKGDNGYDAGRLLRANTVDRYKDEENGEWKFLMFDENAKSPKMPKGTVGHRWQSNLGQWNLELKDGLDDSPIAPALSLIDLCDEVFQVNFEDFSNDNATVKRGVPVKYIDTAEGRVAVTTIFDLLIAHYGVSRDLDGEYPKSYDEADQPYTPAWQEKFTGIDKATVINFANQFATTAEKTDGKCTVIIGAGINHWYHNNLMYRGPMTALMLCGCVGKNGGGLAHYVGQEKLAPISMWKTVAMATDWGAPRLQNAPTWHYIHCDQWRYEGPFAKYSGLKGDNEWTQGHAADTNARAVRMGWLPFYPQFEKSSLGIVKEAEQAGAKTDNEIIQYTVDLLKERTLRFAAEDPDHHKNWPRVWFIWRGNAIMASGKGHEYFLHHYLGTHSNKISEEEISKEMLQEVVWRDETPVGKMDLVVDINFRMDTSALYSDIVLPTAHWYEKNDINTTDLHSFVHPLSEAVPPNWEARTDWNIFKAIAEKVSKLAEKHLPEPMKDLVCTPLEHDYPDELAQPSIKDWARGECEPIPGKTMPKMKIITRDYRNLYNRYISLGTDARNKGIGAHGVHWPIDDMYDKFLTTNPTTEWGGKTYPSLDHVIHAINVILRFAPETNGESAYRAFEEHEKKVGLPLKDLGEGNRNAVTTYEDIQRQPRRILTSPCWSGLVNNGRAYSPFCMSVERLVPWRTLTGRQHFYLDHEGYLAFGEHLPTYKPKISPMLYGDFLKTKEGEPNSIMLNYLTPHGKWHIHSTYYDNHRMLTLSRGIEPFWMNPKDAEKVGVVDNDWVEVYNDHGVVVTRSVVSARIPQGVCIWYHSPERTISIPKSPLRNNRRAGGHNSLTRTRLKPVLMMGGYGQFTFHLNYWGPTGVNRDTHVLVRKLQGEPQF